MKQIKTIVALLFAAVLMTACGGASAGPVSLDGEWETSNGDFGMEAEVEEGWIIIDLRLEDSTGLYWKGTVPQEVEEGTIIHSSADVEALEFALFGSQSEEKEFTYEDGKIKFEFEIMGTKTDVEMERTE